MIYNLGTIKLINYISDTIRGVFERLWPLGILGWVGVQ